MAQSRQTTVKKKKNLLIRMWEYIKKNTKKNIVHGPLQYNMVFALVFLLVFGVIMVYSTSYASTLNGRPASEQLVKRQLQYACLGLALMWGVSKIDYHFWLKFGNLGYLISLALLAMLKIPGMHINALGASRWVKIGPLPAFQAAEPIKLFMMIFFARYLGRYGIQNGKRELCAWAAALVMFFGVFIISDNMSTAIIILGICYCIFLTCTKHTKVYGWLLVGVFAVAILVIILIVTVLPETSTENFRITRIRAFMNPEKYASRTSVQPLQALYAIGAGGFWGKGLGQSLVKFKLAEAYNDYILAIICEEIGAFGVFLLLFIIGYLLYHVVRVGSNACDIEGKIFCVGVFAQILIQTILNFAVVTSFFPSTGVSLPFISYGGASIIFLLIEFGMVFNIDSYSKNKKFRAAAWYEVKEKEKKQEIERMSR